MKSYSDVLRETAVLIETNKIKKKTDKIKSENDKKERCAENIKNSEILA